MGNAVQPSSKLVESESVVDLAFLEEGNFCKIYKGKLANNLQAVTVKVPRVYEQVRKDKKELVKLQVDEIRRVWPELKKARSEHVVRYLGVAYDDFRKEVWLIRQFVDGIDLHSLMRMPSLCPELASPERKLELAVGIARGMSYLHCLREPILHGDFKPSDVLVASDQYRTPKIANFGLYDFKQFFVDNGFSEPDLNVNIHQAPEVILDGERPTLFSDWWALAAVILHWMLDQEPWNLQELCLRLRYRSGREFSALKAALRHREEPSIVHRVNQDHELAFIRDCFKYQPVDRCPSRVLAERLDAVSKTPSWNNVAFHKYYG